MGQLAIKGNDYATYCTGYFAFGCPVSCTAIRSKQAQHGTVRLSLQSACRKLYFECRSDGRTQSLLSACCCCHTGASRLNGMWALTSMRPFPAKFPPWLRRETMRLTGLAGALLVPVTALPTLLLIQVGTCLACRHQQRCCIHCF